MTSSTITNSLGEKKFWEQDGGVVLIEYDGLTIGAPRAHVVQAMNHLSESDDKRRILWSVDKAIKKVWKRLKGGTATQKEAMDCGQDIAIWYANEILEGRAKLEETVQ